MVERGARAAQRWGQGPALCIVLTRQTQLGNTMVYVLPITHTPPRTQEDSIKIPAATKKLANSSPDTAYRDILDLTERGALRKDPGGGRSTSYSLVTDDAR